jgi:hypothetical protein
VAGGNPHYSLTVGPRDSRIESHVSLLANLCPGLSEYHLVSELRIMCGGGGGTTTNFSILYVWGKPLTHAALQPCAMGSAGALSLPLVVDVMECLVQSISTNFFQNSEVHYKCPNIYCL